MAERKLLVVFFIFNLLAKLFFNDQASVNGSFKASSAAYIVAVLNISFILTLITFNLSVFRKFVKSPLLLVIFIYYTFALISSLYSPLPIVTSFRAMVGVGFCLVISIIINIYKNYDMKRVMNLLWVILISSFLSSLIFHIEEKGFNFVFGVASGYSALIACFIAQYHIIYKGKRWIFKAALLIVVSIYMKSFSAILALYFSLNVIFLLKRKYILFFIMVVPTILCFNITIWYLENNQEVLILGKKAGAYLIGSGRFDIYKASIDLFFNQLKGLNSFLGVGFQAEREYLKDYDLAWSTDPHNSLITSTLGMGYVGMLLYFVFISIPFFSCRKRFIQEKHFIYGISCHVGSIVYGITSSQYLGVPTMLLIVTTSIIILSQRFVKNSRGKILKVKGEIS